MPLMAVCLSRSTSISICEEDFSTGSSVLAYVARETNFWRTSSSPSGSLKVSGDTLIDVTNLQASACGSFDEAEVCVFFLGAAEELSNLHLLAVVVFLGMLDMVLTVVGVLDREIVAMKGK